MMYLSIIFGLTAVVFAVFAKQRNDQYLQLRNDRAHGLMVVGSEQELKMSVERLGTLAGMSFGSALFTLMLWALGGENFNPCPPGQVYAPFYLNGQPGYQCLPGQR